MSYRWHSEDDMTYGNGGMSFPNCRVCGSVWPHTECTHPYHPNCKCDFVGQALKLAKVGKLRTKHMEKIAPEHRARTVRLLIKQAQEVPEYVPWYKRWWRKLV